MPLEFIARNGVIALASSTISGSLTVTNGITGSLQGTATTASYILSAISSSFASTASYSDSFTVGGTLTAQRIVVQTISSSVVFSSGSNRFGNDATNTHQFTGSIIAGGSLRLNPTSDPGLISTTASFLYTSASNTDTGYDLFYRQGNNNVKFKWFEGILNTGILHGGVLTYSSSYFYVSQGSGIIVNHNAQTGSEISPTITYVNWNAATHSIVNSGSQNTYVYINSSGNLQQQTSFFTPEQYHEALPIGRISHYGATGSLVTGVGNNMLTSYDVPQQLAEFTRAFGPLKTSGFTITPQVGNLSLNIGSGTAFNLGGYYQNSPDFPSSYNSNTYLTSSIIRIHRSGSGFLFDNNGGSYYTSVNPLVYDDGDGTLATVGNGNWSIQRVFVNPITGRSHVYYGQAIYSTYLNAVQSVATDDFIESEVTKNAYVFAGYLVMRGGAANDDLSVGGTTNAIIQSGLFRNSVGGSGGASIAVSDLNDLADVNITSPSNGQALIYSSGNWINGNPSFASTASYADNFTVGNTLTAQRIVVQTISSSVVFSSGSNRFGNDITNTQSFTGSVGITGSLTVGSSRLLLYADTPPSANSPTKMGYMFSTIGTAGSTPAGSFIEDTGTGTILSYGVNVPQAGARNISYAGGIFRLDTRVGTQEFNILAFPSGSSGEVGRLSISLQNGNTTLVSSGGNVSIGNVGAGSKLQVSGNTAIGYSTSTAAPTNGLTVSGSTLIGTSIDNGYRLQVSSSALGSLYTDGLVVHSGILSGSFTTNNPSSSLLLISGSITPSASLGGASIIYANTTISASANNQTLVGLDINPSWNTGSFTGVTPMGLRIKNQAGGVFSISQNSTYGFVTEIKNTGRMDFSAGNGNEQIFFAASTVYYNSAFILTRLGDATSTATQASSRGFAFQTSLWNGSTMAYATDGFRSIASTTINQQRRLSYLVDSNSTVTTGTELFAIFNSGSVVLQKGGTFTDNGATLQVNGTNIASASLARGVTITNTLSASANGDTLVGLDINPTFTNGAFTGVTNAVARFNGSSQGFVFTDWIGASSNFSIYPKASPTISNYLFRSDNINTHLNAPSSSGILTLRIANQIYGQFFSTTGNFTLQNGGTYTDAGYRLDVAGTTRFQGTTASDTAPLGSELSGVTGTGTNWALAGGATNLNVGGYVHTVGSVVPLTTSLAAVAGTYYQITYTITGRTAGSITIAYGGTSTASVTATGNTGPLASSTAVLTITPTTDFDGTVVLSIKSIGTSSASSTFANSSGTGNIEVRTNSTVSNTFIGLLVGRLNTTGTSNTFIGAYTGIANTTGASNTFVGTSAGAFNTIGSNNSFFGMYCGYANTTGNLNSFFGQGAGQLNTTGASNTFIGQSAGNQNTIGGTNTFLGISAGSGNTTANFNTFLGAYSGQSNSSGSDNTFIGTAAGINNTTGINNTFLGRNAGRYIADKSTSATILNNSIILGYQAGPLADNQINQIVIGHNSTGLGSNTTVLGNSSTATTAIYGDLILGSSVDNGTDKLQVTGNSSFTGSVGISGSLAINGTATIVSASLNYQQNLAVATGSFQTIVSVATGSFRSAFFDYVAFSGSIVRAGTIVSTWSGSVTEYFENFTGDLGGSTAVVTLQTAISASNIVLQAGISGSAWSVRSLVRLL
jgi:hypothetical protein